ncbi:MAG: TIR domain-containing protein [Alphaproteobacteria bacterium]|nr:TIR domain-containing protein [Alphaproteobacteria bacterium]
MSSFQTQINSLLKDIADLRKRDAVEAKKEADLLSKINRASEAAHRTTSASTLQSKLRDAERATKDLAAVQKKRGDFATKIADKSKSLRSYEERQAREDERERKKIADEQRKLMREREAHEKRITNEIRSRASQTQLTALTREQENHDFFISHASEDKDGFVRDLASALRERGANVWYDEFALSVGDSLRRTIDRGLAGSRFGIVVLSEHFFRKEWPNRELDGLVALEVEGRTRILPIWHKVSKDEVASYSPTLADKVALNSSLKSISEIADELIGLLG